MPEGPFGGPRPFVGASLIVQFESVSRLDTTSAEIEQRLRRNGFTRADVRIDEASMDSRTRIMVMTSEEQMSYAVLRRLVEQVKDEVNVNLSNEGVDVFCT